MKPDQQNYWEPEQNTPPPVPQPTQPPVPVQPQPPAQPGVSVSPHEQTFVPPPEAPLPAEQAQSAPVSETISWEASEYIHHEKDGRWFLLFGIVVLVLMAIAIFLIQSWLFAVLIVIMAVALFVYTRRPPRVVRYSLSPDGLHTGQEYHQFSEFRAFGVVQDGAFYFVMLLPVKRFMPATNVYFSEQDGERIVDLLATYLPMEQLDLDFMDRFLRKIRL